MDLIDSMKPIGVDLSQYDKRLPMAILLTKFGLLVCVHRKYSVAALMVARTPIEIPKPNFPMAQVSMMHEFLCFISRDEVLEDDEVIKIGL